MGMYFDLETDYPQYHGGSEETPSRILAVTLSRSSSMFRCFGVTPKYLSVNRHGFANTLISSTESERL